MANVVLNDAIKMVGTYLPEQAKVVAWGNRTVDMIGSTVGPIAQRIISVAQDVLQKEETKFGCNLLAGSLLFTGGISLLFGSSSKKEVVHFKQNIELPPRENKPLAKQEVPSQEKEVESDGEGNGLQRTHVPSSKAESNDEEVELPETAQNKEEPRNNLTPEEELQLGDTHRVFANSETEKDDVVVSDLNNAGKDSHLIEDEIVPQKTFISIDQTRIDEIPSSLSVRVAMKVVGIINIVAGAVTIYDAYSRTKW